MQSNDLDNKPSYRYFVVAEAVLRKRTEASTVKTGWFKRYRKEQITWSPDVQVLNFLWRWSGNLGVRVELLFLGDMSEDAVFLWDMIEATATNPFYDWHLFESPEAVRNVLAYRNDVMGVIDIPERTSFYGGRGLGLENLR